MGEGGERRYRIDDLARRADTTVRNVRAYQDRGLLPPPEKSGRVAWYSEAHLARLRLIGDLLARGYTLANITELVDGWISGQDLGDLLGLEAALVGPWDQARPVVYQVEELRDLFAGAGGDGAGFDAALAAASSAGLVTAEGGAYRIVDGRLVEGAKVLVEAGVPLEAVLEMGAVIVASVDRIAASYVDTVATHVAGSETVDSMSAERLAQLGEIIGRLRPLATDVVSAALAGAMERRIRAEVGGRLSARGVTGATFPFGPS